MAKIGIIMGSDSDWRIMQAADHMLNEFDVDHESKVVSAHRRQRCDGRAQRARADCNALLPERGVQRIYPG